MAAAYWLAMESATAPEVLDMLCGWGRLRFGMLVGSRVVVGGVVHGGRAELAQRWHRARRYPDTSIPTGAFVVSQQGQCGDMHLPLETLPYAT